MGNVSKKLKIEYDKCRNLLRKKEVHQIIKLDVLIFMQRMMYILFNISLLILFFCLEIFFRQRIVDTNSIFGLQLTENQTYSVAISVFGIIGVMHVMLGNVLMYKSMMWGLSSKWNKYLDGAIK